MTQVDSTPTTRARLAAEHARLLEGVAEDEPDGRGLNRRISRFMATCRLQLQEASPSDRFWVRRRLRFWTSVLASRTGVPFAVDLEQLTAGEPVPVLITGQAAGVREDSYLHTVSRAQGLSVEGMLAARNQAVHDPTEYWHVMERVSKALIARPSDLTRQFVLSFDIGDWAKSQLNLAPRVEGPLPEPILKVQSDWLEAQQAVAVMSNLLLFFEGTNFYVVILAAHYDREQGSRGIFDLFSRQYRLHASRQSPAVIIKNPFEAD